jgi:hypothetical protein
VSALALGRIQIHQIKSKGKPGGRAKEQNAAYWKAGRTEKEIKKSHLHDHRPILDVLGPRREPLVLVLDKVLHRVCGAVASAFVSSKEQSVRQTE